MIFLPPRFQGIYIFQSLRQIVGPGSAFLAWHFNQEATGDGVSNSDIFYPYISQADVAPGCGKNFLVLLPTARRYCEVNRCPSWCSYWVPFVLTIALWWTLSLSGLLLGWQRPLLCFLLFPSSSRRLFLLPADYCGPRFGLFCSCFWGEILPYMLGARRVQLASEGGVFSLYSFAMSVFIPTLLSRGLS